MAPCEVTHTKKFAFGNKHVLKVTVSFQNSVIRCDVKYVILTLKSKAGIGVKRLMWIMHRTLGRWPSLEPTKNNLQEKKVNNKSDVLTLKTNRLLNIIHTELNEDVNLDQTSCSCVY